MAIMRPNFSFDDSLIISRWQQKELSHLLSSQSPLLLDPFIDQLPIKIGLCLNLLGSRIVSCQIERGFLAIDLEKHLAQLDFLQAQKAMARLNQCTPIFAQLGFTIAMEQLLKIEVDNELKEMRCFMIEYSRIFHHWHVIENMMIAIKQFSIADLAHQAIRIIKPSHELLCRIYNKTDLPRENIKHVELKNIILETQSIAKEIESAITFDQTIRQALRKKAVVTQSVASSYGLTGLFLRANRNLYDLRVQNQNLGYSHLPTTELAEGGDAWARLCLRSREIISSIEWLKKSSFWQKSEHQQIEPLKEERALDVADFKEPFAFGEIDSPEGNLKISVFMDQNKKANFFIRTPAYFIAQALPHLLAQSDLSDLPVILYSLGIRAEEIDR